MDWRSEGQGRWLEAALPGARAAFSTRLGGVSEAPFESLNLGILTEDEPASVIENRRRLAAMLGFEPERVAIGRQVHGAELQTHSGPQTPSPFAEPGSEIAEVDGQVIDEPGLAALVFVADCLPVAARRPRRSGDAPLRLARARGRDRRPGRRGRGGDRCRDRPGNRRLLLRGRRRGPRCVRRPRARNRRRSRCSTWSRSPGACSSAPASSGSRSPASARAASRSSSSPTAATTARPAARPALAWLEGGD